jgi:zinc transport system permease protein
MELLHLQFVQRALLAGILVGFVGSYYGVFVVQRKMSFMGDGLAHAAFGGIALGLLLQYEPLWIAIPFTIIVSIAITWLKDKTELGIDTTIGIFFAISVALGIIFISLKKEYSVDAYSYLFGSILYVSAKDIIMIIILSVITVSTAFGLWQRWAFATFDPEMARTDRLNVTRDDYILSVLMSVTIVVAIKLVGIILIVAYLVIPPATARLLAGTFFKMTIYSIIIGILSSVIGLFLSLEMNIPSGATIILVGAAFFLFALFINRLKRA